eukprot:365162-Chlamydomonas_euryale.AAC.6
MHAESDLPCHMHSRFGPSPLNLPPCDRTACRAGPRADDGAAQDTEDCPLNLYARLRASRLAAARAGRAQALSRCAPTSDMTGRELRHRQQQHMAQRQWRQQRRGGQHLQRVEDAHIQHVEPAARRVRIGRRAMLACSPSSPACTTGHP